MEWNNSLSVGVNSIDIQHQELIKKINNFLEVCNQAQGKEKVKEVMEYVVDYCQRHFRDEESLMRVNKYPEYEAHKKIHNQFLAEAKELQKKLVVEGPTLTNMVTVNKKLVEWLINHINKVDKAFGTYLKNK